MSSLYLIPVNKNPAAPAVTKSGQRELAGPGRGETGHKKATGFYPGRGKTVTKTGLFSAEKGHPPSKC